MIFFLLLFILSGTRNVITDDMSEPSCKTFFFFGETNCLIYKKDDQEKKPSLVDSPFDGTRPGLFLFMKDWPQRL